jgi:hypothetical protein
MAKAYFFLFDFLLEVIDGLSESELFRLVLAFDLV